MIYIVEQNSQSKRFPITRHDQVIMDRVIRSSKRGLFGAVGLRFGAEEQNNLYYI